MEINKKIPVIYLTSYGHSGSTILDLIFDSHSKVVGVGELSQYFAFGKRNILCTCRKELFDCPFWQEVFHNVSENSDLRIVRNKTDFLLDRNSYFYYHNRKKAIVNLKEHFKQREKLYKRILFNSCKEIVFDSSKKPHPAEVLFLSNKFDVTLVHLVRDGRGVIYSYKKSYPERSSLAIAWNWAATNLKIEIIKRRYPDKCFFVRYSDFAKNPEQVVKRLTKQLGLKYESSMLKFDEKIHHQAGGNVNARIHRKKDNQIKEDLSWKTGLSFWEKFVFNLFFGWLNFYYQKIKK